MDPRALLMELQIGATPIKNKQLKIELSCDPAFPSTSAYLSQEIQTLN